MQLLTTPYKGKYKVGSTHSTPYGDVVVLEVIQGTRGRGSAQRVVIRFLATGTVRNVQTNNISQGKVKDWNAPTVYGVGYIGSELRIPQRGVSTVRRAYDLWANMLKRAYGGFDPSYEDVTVDPRWHSFTRFLNSMPGLPGYDEWEAGADLHLDKDKRIPGNRTYGLDTCWLIPAEVNLSK